MECTMELENFIIRMASLMSVTGYEDFSLEELKALVGDCFDSCTVDVTKNIVLVKKCGRENAPRILVDAHMDEIGMYVSDIKDGGFLSVVNIGGLDTRIMQAADVVIYGKERIHGIVASTPPHLARPEDKGKLKKVSDLIIDTGYSKEELEKIVSIGTPVGFYPKYTRLKNNFIAGKGFDDKACAACALSAVMKTDRSKLAGDIYVTLSAHEETDRDGFIVCSAFNIRPDYAMVIDVNLGKTPDTKAHETVDMRKGPSVTLSAVVDRKLTQMVCRLCESKSIKYQKCVSASSTGTNTTSLALVGEGIPVVDVGLPLKSMHTYNEVLSLDDAEQLECLVAEFICDKGIAEVFFDD